MAALPGQTDLKHGSSRLGLHPNRPLVVANNTLHDEGKLCREDPYLQPVTRPRVKYYP